MSKIVKGIVIGLSILFFIVVVLFVILLIKFGFNFKEAFSTSRSNKLILEKEVEFVDDINIDFDIADVIIEENKDNKIKVELYSDHPKEYHINLKDDKLDIVLNETKLNFIKKIFNRKTGLIIVKMPKDADSKLNITGNIGDIKLSSYAKAKLKARLDIGDLKVEEIDEVEAKVNIGDIKIKRVNNYLDLNVKTGSVKVNKLNITKDSIITVNVGDVKIDETNDIYIDAKVRVGDIDIKNNNRKADIVLTIKVDIGDIDVDNESIIENIKEIKELDIYKKIEIDKVNSVEIIKFTVGGDQRESFTNREDIESYYKMIGSIKIGEETKQVCEDNTTVYVFHMKDDKVSFEFECNWFVLNNKRYKVVK